MLAVAGVKLVGCEHLWNPVVTLLGRRASATTPTGGRERLAFKIASLLYPTDPSISRSISRFNSTLYSIGN